MKFKSSLLTQASGSIGGVTASRNKGGLYLRARATPTNPSSPQQQAVRALMSSLTSLWVDTLTDAQREAWKIYADNVPLIDSLGEPRNIPPLAHYVRSNVPRLQAGLDRVDDAPTIFDLSPFTMPGITSITASTGVAVVTFTAGDDWASEVGAALLVLGSRGYNPTINYFKGPFRYAGKVAGAGTPPASPANITMPFVLAADQRAFLQFSVCRADGRLSTSYVLGKICV